MPTLNTQPGTAGLSGNPYELSAWAFENAWAVAQNKSTTSDSLFNKALNAVGSAPSVTPARFQFNPNVVEPLVNIPQQAEGASVAKFYEMSTAVINQLAGLFEGYITKYLPDESDYLGAAQRKLYEMLTDGGSGINPLVEDQIWQRDRQRILNDAMRAEEENMAVWAARRYPMPPGAAMYQALQIRRDAADKIAESSRALSIKQMEIEIENVKFAIEASIKLYAAAMSAASDYIKAMAIGPQSGMQLIPSITDSQAKLIGAANEYYRSRISVEELKLKASMPAAEWDQQARLKNAELVMQEIKAKVDAAVSAAQSLGTQAASALNSLHASASVSGSGSNSVSYSYSNDTASPGITPAWA